jgi:hypothetical protein
MNPAAPVIRTVLSLYDRPQHPLKLESFINIEDPEQRAAFAALATQGQLLVLFYDQDVRHRLSKRVPYRAADRAEVPRILARAEELWLAIPPARFDFDRAKAAVLRNTTL